MQVEVSLHLEEIQGLPHQKELRPQVLPPVAVPPPEEPSLPHVMLPVLARHEGGERHFGQAVENRWRHLLSERLREVTRKSRKICAMKTKVCHSVAPAVQVRKSDRASPSHAVYGKSPRGAAAAAAHPTSAAAATRAASHASAAAAAAARHATTRAPRSASRAARHARPSAPVKTPA